MFEALLRGCVNLFNLVKILFALRREDSRFFRQDGEDGQDKGKYEELSIEIRFLIHPVHPPYPV